MTEIIYLSEDMLIGQGDHKKTYRDPTCPDRCIKIPMKTPDEDLEKELKYRRSRERRKLKSNLLTAYYGEVMTNLGKGYMFERVHDYNDTTSKLMGDLLKEACSDDSKLPFVEEVLKKLKALLSEELIVVSNLEVDNIAIQRISETKYIIRIIDNLGSPAVIPLAYYSDFLTRRRTVKYWKRFLEEIQRHYPKFMTEDLKSRLR